MTDQSQSKLVVFEDKKIRRIFHKGEWYFVSAPDMPDLLESGEE